MSTVVAYPLIFVVPFLLVVVGIGKPRASVLAMTLFACGMAFMLWVVLMRLDPFTGRDSVPLTPISAAYENFLPR